MFCSICLWTFWNLRLSSVKAAVGQNTYEHLYTLSVTHSRSIVILWYDLGVFQLSLMWVIIAARLFFFLNPNRYMLELSNEVLWVHVAYVVSKISKIKVSAFWAFWFSYAHASILPCTQVLNLMAQIFQSLIVCNFAVSWPKSMISISFERSKTYLLGARIPRA